MPDPQPPKSPLEHLNWEKNKVPILIAAGVAALAIFFSCCGMCGVGMWIFPASRTQTNKGGGGGQSGQTDEPVEPPLGTSKHGKPLSEQQFTRKIAGSRFTHGEKLLLNAEDANDLLPGSLRVSPDGTRHAYLLKRTGGTRVVVDGKPNPNLYEDIPLANFIFSGDGRHFFFRQAGTASYHKDGKEVPLSLSVKEGFQPWVIEDMSVSHDGARVLVVATSKGYVNFQNLTDRRVMIDGRSSGEVLESSNIRLFKTPLLRWAALDSPTSDTVRVTVDGKKSLNYGRPTSFSYYSGTPFPIEVAGPSSYAFIARRDNKEFVVLNGQERKLHDAVTGVILSPNGKRFAYWAKISADAAIGRAAADKLYVDDEAIEHYVSTLVFSSDSAHWSGIGSAGYGSSYIVVDDQRGPTYSACTQPVFSPDGRNLAYAATKTDDQGNSQQFVVFNGQEQEPYTFVSGSILFSPNSTAYAYVARKSDGKAIIVVNGHEGPAWDDLQFASDKSPILRFSDDARSIGYVAKVGDFWAAVLDGKQSQTYDQIGPEETRIGFTPSGSFTYLAIRKGAIYWVEEKRN